MENKEYSYIEWNIRGASGSNNYTTPHFVVETILQKDADIVVLVEFYISPTFDYMITLLSKKYHVFISPFTSGCNQVLIALKKFTFKENQICEVNAIDPLDVKLPEFLSVKLKIGDKYPYIIGVRIKTQKGIRDIQMEYLSTMFGQIDTFICIGDFNMVVGNVEKCLKNVPAYSPRTYNDENWSFVHDNGDKVGIDLIVAKGVLIEKNAIRNKQYAEYDWGFVNNKNGYTKTNGEYLGCSNRPDHAILKGTFILE